MQRGPFEAFLRERTVTGGRGEGAGTVLPVADIKRLNRTRGWRLERWQLRRVAERC